MNVYSLFLFVHYDFLQKGGGIMEKTLLDTLKNRVDTKVGVIAALNTTLKALQNIKPEEKKPISLDGNKLILITNFANISCEIINLNDEENKDLSNAQFIIKTALKTTENYYESLKNCAENWHICTTPLKGAKEFYNYVKNKGYGIYVLSNASDKFYDYFPNFLPLDFFNGIVLSSDIHILKPNEEIFFFNFFK